MVSSLKRTGLTEAALAAEAVAWLRTLGFDARDTSLDYRFAGRAPDITAMDAQEELWTVEAKLHDWRHALQQAREHRICSDFAFVLMPRIPRSLHLREFRVAGVGFILGGGGVPFRQILVPRRSETSARGFCKDFLADYWPSLPITP